MEQRKKVLILCTRNSARSQIAEVVLRDYAGDRFEVYSAGLQPDRLHPMVAPVLEEIGIDVSGQRSKDVKEFLGRFAFRYVIVVCENAERNCPKIFPGPGERLYWPFDDPASVKGTEEEQLEAFRRARPNWRSAPAVAARTGLGLARRERMILMSQAEHKDCYGTMFPSILHLEVDKVISGKALSFELRRPNGMMISDRRVKVDMKEWGVVGSD